MIGLHLFVSFPASSQTHSFFSIVYSILPISSQRWLIIILFFNCFTPFNSYMPWITKSVQPTFQISIKLRFLTFGLCLFPFVVFVGNLYIFKYTCLLKIVWLCLFYLFIYLFIYFLFCFHSFRIWLFYNIDIYIYIK